MRRRLRLRCSAVLCCASRSGRARLPRSRRVTSCGEPRQLRRICTGLRGAGCIRAALRALRLLWRALQLGWLLDWWPLTPLPSTRLKLRLRLPRLLLLLRLLRLQLALLQRPGVLLLRQVQQ